MKKEKVERAIKLFRHRQEEAEKAISEGKPKKGYWLGYVVGSKRAYEFCANYIEANFQKK